MVKDSVNESEGEAVQESVEGTAQHFFDICIFILLLLLLLILMIPHPVRPH